MTDSPAPAAAPAPAPSRSVVIETNSRVSVPKWPLWTALAAVVALAAFTAIWFVTRKDDGVYRPGPVALALVDAVRADGGQIELSSAELACVDRVGAGVDPDDVRDGMQLTDPTLSDDAKEFIGTVFDDCLVRESRVALFAQDVTFAGEPVTGEAAVCVAEHMDDSILESGGYSAMAADATGQTDLLGALFGAFASCDVM